MVQRSKQDAIQHFNFRPGRRLGAKYEIIELLGQGYEGEVYKVREITTGIERAAKFFYPARNLRDRTITYYAKKLNKLNRCPILIPYLTHDQIRYRNQAVKFLVSEFVSGMLLEDFLRRQPGKRMQPFEALHFLYTLTTGLEAVHTLKEYHGDLHQRNIIIKRHGIGFDIKLIDIYRWNVTTAENIREDVYDIIHLFYEVLGGRKYYSKMPPEVKSICLGLKRTLIRRKFRTAGHLRAYLENLEWSDS